MPACVCLLMGVNYPGTAAALRGCVNDAENLRGRIVASGAAAAHDVTVLCEPTGREIVGALRALARRTHAERVAHAFVSFSGHGTSMPDADGDELDGRDECICPSDYAARGVLRDDELGALLAEFSPRTRVTLLVDCCHSGTCFDLPFTYTRRGEPQPAAAAPRAPRPCHPDVVMISGCRDEETSADVYDHARHEHAGAMTSALLDALAVDPALAGDAFSLLDAMRALLRGRRLAQAPQLSTSRALHTAARVPFFPA